MTSAASAAEVVLPGPHALDVARVGTLVGSDPSRGLDEDEAWRRLEHEGPNELEPPARPSYARLFARQFLDPLVALLAAATAVSAAIGEHVEASAIGAIIVLNALLGFAQEAAAERAVLALRQRLEIVTSVVRDGRERDLPAREVVRGDLLVLREGDRVAADARVLEAHALEVDEAPLTGESLPVAKTADPVAPAAELAERASLVFAGTSVTAGRGRAFVVATGRRTELGTVAGLVARAVPPPTPLQRRLGRLARAMVAAGLAITVVLMLGMLGHGASAREGFLVGVAVAVAAVPEGLAATVTIALALGARAMAQRGAIVRRLSSIETLGETTVICTDKTGTLTENTLELTDIVPLAGVETDEVLAAAVLASTSTLDRGDPVERAILRAAAARGLTRESLLAPRRRVHEVPFHPDRRRMTVVYDHGGRLHAFVKGAPEAVLERASLSAEERTRLEEAVHRHTGRGHRVLAVADRGLPDGHVPEGLDHGLRPLGLIALYDPLRPAAAVSVRAALDAGIGVKMVTGDHPSTAAAVAAEVGLPSESVFARVTPAAKLALVERLQQAGEVVAVTGDGVNDAPALRRADVGVAMGRSGTEAAREASAIVISDDDFATIVAAISEGRRIADNVRKVVAFLLSANLGEVLLFAAAVLGGLGAPMTVVQVLIVNLVTDGLPALALARDRAHADLMARGPARRTDLFGRPLLTALLVGGTGVGAAGLAAYMIGRGSDHETAQTMAFATVALAELAFVFACRSPSLPAWQAPENRALLLGTTASALLVAAAVYLAPLREVAGTTALTLSQQLTVAALALIPFIATETLKPILRARGRA
jgi:calcium-translocating P-type ATPase